jgi:hypothetical protein
MFDRVFGVYVRGFDTVVSEPGRVYRVVLVSTGEVAKTLPGSVQRASNLSMLESTPLIGAALALPVGVVLSRFRGKVESDTDSNSGESETVSTDGGSSVHSRGRLDRNLGRLRRAISETASPTDAFLVAVSALLVFVYLPRLPVQGQITMRYLTPLYPVAVYAVCRHRRLGDELVDRIRTIAYAYEATVLLGVPLAVAIVLWFRLGEAATFDALAGAGVVVGSALALATVVVLATNRGGGILAGLVGVAAGTATAFVLLSQLVLFHYGIHLLPLVQSLTEAIRLILVRMTV